MNRDFDRESEFGWAGLPERLCFPLLDHVRHLLAVGLIVLAAVSSFAAPFAQKIPYTQPGGTPIELWGEGDEFYAVFESLDGYTVVFDPATKAYQYAQLSPDGSSLLPTGALVGKDDPATLGLAKHLRITPEAAKAQAQQRFQQWDQETGTSERWAALKAARQKALAAAREGKAINARPSFTTTGVKAGLTLLIDFTDDVATMPQTNITAYCNADGYTGYGNNGSVKEYYYDVSGGMLTYTNVVTCYIRAPHPKSYYNDTSGAPGLPGAGDLVRDCIGVMTNMSNYATEILPLLEALTVDGSSNILACNVLFAGANSGVWARGLWPCSSSFSTPISLPGTEKKIKKWQITNIGTSLVLGTFCHENGHMLCGFPDIYDYGGESRGGAGAFCIMDSGGPGTNPVQFCAYLKDVAGWAITTDIPPNSSQSITVSSSGVNFNRFYRYSKPGVSTEYFLVENRQKSGRDISLPATGIAIWHIDELGNKDNQSLTNNFSHANYEVTLVQADNLWHFERNVNTGDANDLYYTGNTAAGYSNQFTDYSGPNAHWWDGTLSGVRFRDFSGSGSTMTFAVFGYDAPVGGGTTNVVNGVTVNNSGDYMVGSNGSFYALVITNAGKLVVTTDSIIGYTPYSSNNSARVTGAGSVWTSGTNLYVGAFGANNSLTIAGGGYVSAVSGHVGLGADADSNSVLVTDAGSIWSNSGSALQIGVAGSFNQMTIVNGGVVVSSNSLVGAALGAASNAVLVGDSGSIWTNNGSLSIGNLGSGNDLTITNGGRVFNNVACIGVASGSVNNAVLVSSAGSFWRSAGSLYVGSNGAGNSLRIASGAQVSDVGGYIGHNTMSSSNAVFVSGTGSAWTNSSNLYVGNYGSGNDLSVSGGAIVYNTSGYIGNNGSAAGNMVLVTDAGSVWTNSSSLYVGNNGSNNSLVIADGGQVFNGYGYIGNGSSASNNSALVTGAGSTWNSANNFFVGVNGSGGRLIITNGGQVNVSGGGNIGSAVGSTNNAVVVTGVGSVWSNGISTYVGVNGSSNRLTITGGGTVIDVTGQVGLNFAASNNTVVVSGSGSLWTNSRNLYMGNGSIGNLLAISGGGQVVSVTGFVGFTSFSTNNAVFVSDSGSLWNNLADLHVGSTGSFNQLSVINGGMVRADADAYVGYSGGASNNWVFVTGAGSVWSNAGVLTVGRGGLGNGVTLADGGQVYASVLSNLNGSVFSMSGGNAFFSRVYNAATITQTGGQFDPDFFGNAGLLQIADGTNIAAVFLNEIPGVVEQSGGEMNANYATNFGTWISSGGVANLTNFENMAGAQLIGVGGVFNGSITSAGTLSFSNSLNTLPVSGDVTLLAGSLVAMNAGGTNLSLLDRLSLCGLLTAGGTLRVSLQGDYTPTVGDVFDLFDYGAVAGGFDHLKLPTLRGYVWDTSHLLASAADPLSGAIVFGMLSAGSLTNIIDGVVTNAGAVYTLGDSSSMDDMIITNGGVLIDDSGILGNQAEARYNRAIVTGAGSIWNNSNDFYVGYGGFGNQLILTNGGTVLALNAYVGCQTSASNNAVIVMGPGSVWSNAGVLTVGHGGTDNGVTLGDEGRIYATVLSNLNDSIISVSGGSLFVSQTYNGATIVQDGGRFDQGFLDNAGLLQLTNGTNIVAALLNEDNGTIQQDGGEQHAGAATNFGVWTVSGGSFYATNGSANGSLENRGGILTLNGGSVEADRFLVTNSTFNFNAGTLVTRGGQIYMPSASNLFVGTTPNQVGTWNVQGGTTVIRWSGSAGETVLGGFAGVTSCMNITGSGTLWSNLNANLEIGMQSGGNLLTISDGARAFNLTGIVGNSTMATNNSAIVNGTGSMWSNANSLIIGYGGRSNTLAVGSGAIVVNSIGFIGRDDGASDNLAQVSGDGSLWRNSSTLFLGYAGQCNSLVISAGAHVFANAGTIGNISSANSNIAVVSGAASLWSNSTSLAIGLSGRLNSMFVTNGGSVLNTVGVLGSGSSAISNMVLVSDADSVWSNSSILQIGLSGNGNSLTIANGGRVYDTSGRVGINSGANNNNVLVADPGSLWRHSGELLLGSNSYGNRLIITNGGQVSDASATIGYTNRNNSALVTGSGSVWSNAGSLFIGCWGTANSLTLADGGTVTATNLIVGVVPGFGGNAVTNAGGNLIVTNATCSARLEIRTGSLILNGGSITADTLVATNNTFSITNSVLDFNAGMLTTRGNSQIISAGSNNFIIGGLPGAAAVWNVLGGTSVVQQLSGSTSNTVLGGLAGATGAVNVAGSGTVWSNANNLWVGGASAGNQLIVTNGAHAIDYHGYLGYSSIAASNSALVSGAGSLWSNTANLYVGNSGFSNVLLISNAGAVFDVTGYVGNNSSANSNRVLVTGSSSIWRNSGTLYVGNGGKVNGLTVANGGCVVNTSGYVGNNSSANDNFVLVQDSGSLWSNSGALYIGSTGSSNSLIIANGGQVFNAYCYIGNNSSASNNSVWVTDSGSTWENSGNLFVGNNGIGSRLLISDNGTVTASNVFVGANAGASNNVLTITGGNLIVTNTAGGGLNVRRGTMTPNSGTVTVRQFLSTNGASSVVNVNGGSLTTLTLLNAGEFSMTDGTLSVSSVFTNAAGGTFNLSGGSVLVPLEMNNMGTFIQSGGFFDPEVFTNSGSFALSGGTNIAEVFLNLLSGTVTQSGGEQDVNYATNFGSWTVSGGVANLTNFVNDGSATLTVSGGTLNGSVTVGGTGSFNQLTITNGGTVLSSGNGIVGNSSISRSNGVWITDAGSIWSNSANLFVGNNGSLNSLTIANGARVLSATGSIGNMSSANNNYVLVSGGGSFWSNSANLFIGQAGSSNTLAISNGATVYSSSPSIANNGGVGNRVIISGPGSVWTNKNTLMIGSFGGFSQVTVTNGGKLYDFNSFVGSFAVASNNTVIITGTGSLWSSWSNITIGSSSSANQLIITNGGRVANSSAYLGYAASASNNAVVVSGPGSVWTNSSVLYVGYSGSGNQLTIANSGKSFNVSGYIGHTANASNNMVLVTGAGSVWSNGSALSVGNTGSFNQLVIANGGKVYNSAGNIGFSADSVSNIVIVTGAGSIWTNSSSLYVGATGAFNTLSILYAGVVQNTYGVLGYGTSSSNNSAVVSGSGSTWRSSLDFYVGLGGSDNNLTVSNDGTVLNAGSLYVGYDGAGNNLTIANTGRMYNYIGTIGYNATADNNGVVVSGVGSAWTNSSDLYVGRDGSGNWLAITNGGMVADDGASVGYNDTAHNNAVLLAGTGSVWKNNNTVSVGYYGSSNRFAISNGARATNSTWAYVGWASSANNNQVTVVGAESRWEVGEALSIGQGGSWNSLVISNGARVIVNNTIVIGANYTASNNQALVTDPGTLWNGSSTVNVGDGGSASSLIISNGAAVVDLFANVGVQGNSNSARVTGFGSLWSNKYSIAVGVLGSNNQLIITNGAGIISGSSYIGSGTGSNSIALISGSGSYWTNSSDMFVGQGGSGSKLVISDGARVDSANGYVGSYASASNCSVIVIGSGARWNNSGNLLIGTNGAGSTLDIVDGGTVIASNVVVGVTTASIGNIITVSAGSLFATNITHTGTLDIRRGALTLNSGTVTVNRLLATNGASSVVNINGGSLATLALLNAGQFSMTNGTLSVSGAFTNAAGGTFNLSGGTNIAEVFLNLLSGTVTQSGGEQDVNDAINFGSWSISGGVANLTNFINEDHATLTVSGGTLNGSVTVGGTGSFNQLTVTNGGLVIGSIGLVGNSSTARSNSALVTGAGSVWSNSGNLYIGSTGSFNQLTITNAAVTINNNGYIGFNNNGHNNTVLVAGSGSIWKNNSYLYVGNSGSSNQLTIQNGGVVRNTYCYIGNNASSSNNTVLVTGADSVWSNSAILIVGENGPGNQLTIANGGTVFNTTCFIGDLFGANSNTVLVTGVGSVWSNKVSLFVGNFSSGNQLTITDGGVVFAASATVGNSNNNRVLVAGTGSVWNSSGSLVVGSSASGNQLTITNGGTVFNTYAILGSSPGANSNVVLVTGGESVWSNSSGLTVGNDGVSNRLTIANGGAVFSTSGYIGYSFGGNSNAVLVTGADSVWLNTSNLWVGTFSSGGNQLTISDGGAVVGANIVIGYLPSTGNIIAVSGGNLFGTNAAANGTLNVRYGTLTLNSGTVIVNQLIATNGISSVVNFNGGTLNSGGSTVNNGSIFTIGNGTSAANLHLLGGSHTFANSLFINTNGWLTGTGAITGVITNAGSIAPGDSPGILTVSSDLTLLNNSLLTMELAGTNDGFYDQINVSGALAFDGTLTLSLLDGFTVSAGNRFDLFDFSSSSGTFSLTNLPGLDALMYWDTSELYASGEIEADWMSGSLQVTLTPAAVVSAGAQWQVDGGAWQNSGDTVSDLVIGDHTLAFKDVEGWIKPTNQVVQVNFGETTVTNGSYEVVPLLLAAVSRKTHGAAGDYDLNLNLNGVPNATIEPRLGGPNKVVFTFNKEIVALDGILSANEFTLTNATYSSASIVSSNLTLNLASVVDQSQVTVVLKGIGDLAGNALSGTNAVRISVLYGDVNQSGSVNVTDRQAVKSRLMQVLSNVNFLYDANASGSVNVTDRQVVKANLFHTVVMNGLNALLTTETEFNGTVLPAATLGGALGASWLTWSSDGDAEWVPEVALDGSSAACSGNIGDLNVSWVETTVSGPGTLSFEWKVSSEADADYLTFSIDGMDQPGRISGEVDWQTQTFSIPSGTHRLTWTYAKNRANAAGLDAGWLRHVSFQRSP